MLSYRLLVTARCAPNGKSVIVKHVLCVYALPALSSGDIYGIIIRSLSPRHLGAPHTAHAHACAAAAGYAAAASQHEARRWHR
eukprot:scaffold9098_cov124-Isochrysis_galbana.AAC.4